jgi:transmembrane sensor
MPMPELERTWNLLSRKLTGEASPAEIAEFEALLQQNHALKPICAEAEAFWQRSPVKDNDFLEATYLVHLMRLEEKGHELDMPGNEPPETGKPFRLRKVFWFALPVLAVVIGALFILFGNKQKKPLTEAATAKKTPDIEVSTKNGSHSKIQLPDGSQVWLNAGSKLHYDKSFGNNHREVYLNGEAFFDVVRNPDRPFIIHTTSMKLRVLGTQFNVRCYANEATSEASLVHGSLEVYEKKRGQKWLLKPNEKIVVYHRPLKAVKHNAVSTPAKEEEEPPLVALKQLTYNNGDSVAVETAWTKNRLSFKTESFENVARKMERWYDAEFVFSDERKKELTMYGSFTTESLEQALAALEFSFNFRYRIEKRKVYIY